MSADRDGLGDSGTGDVPATGDQNRPELDVDSAFAALVAQFSTPSAAAADGSHPWPASEDLHGDDDETPDQPSAGTSAGPITGPAAGQSSGQAAGQSVGPSVGRGAGSGPGPSTEPPRRRSSDTPTPDVTSRYAAFSAGVEPAYPAELDEHFVPPEPPPLPRGDLVSRLAWAGVIGGPLFLLIAAMLSTDLPAGLLLGALAAFIGGFVTLVARMPGEHPEDGDDGAVV